MSFFRYPGGKKKIKKLIKSNLYDLIEEEQLQYREPFFGAGSIGLSFMFDSKNINSFWINDKDIGICCLWTTIINYADDFINLVNCYEPTVNDFYDFKNDLLNIKSMPITKNEIINVALKKLVIHQISFSGLGTKSGGPLGGKEQKSIYKIDCRWSPQNINKNVLNFTKQFSKFKNNSLCTNLDFEEIINDNSSNALIYLDPPYYIKGNELYQFGFTEADHIRLMKALKGTTHSWLLSYDDCSEIRDLYSWANIESLEVKYSISGATKKGELLISNIKK